jgi:hypothetical protein
MGRRTILRYPLDLFNLIVCLSLAAVLAFLASRPGPEAAITVRPVIASPFSGATVSADELRALEGTADPGVALQFFDGDQLLGGTVAGQEGTFRFPLSSALSEGPHSVRAVAVDGEGQGVLASEMVAFTVVPPAE